MAMLEKERFSNSISYHNNIILAIYSIWDNKKSTFPIGMSAIQWIGKHLARQN